MSGQNSSRSAVKAAGGIPNTPPNGPKIELPTQPPSQTPRTHKSTTTKKQTSARPSIAKEMKSEIISCSFEDFQKNYLPFIPPEEVVHRVCEVVKKIPDATFNATKGALESTNFSPIGKICRCIGEVKMKDLQRERNSLFYHTVPNTPITSGIEGCSHRIDACLTNEPPKEDEDDHNLEKIHAANITLPFEFKTNRSKEELHKNQLQIIGAAVHTMNDDPRRQFMFAITIEGNRMSVWYFSRSHSAKSISVDINEEPEKFVSLMISLYHATYEELGFDPNVCWVQEEDAFVYTVHEKLYKATASIVEHRHECLTGRSTRVFMVKEVKSLDDLTPVDNKEKVLKDVWLDAGARSEGQIQLALFGDIKKFAADPKWRQDPRLKHLSKHPESITELEYLFQEKRYKTLFLLIADEFGGVISKSIPKESYYPINLLPGFKSKPGKTIGPDSQRLISVPTTRDNQQLKPITKEERAKRSYAPKRRYFMIFDDVCKTVDALPMVGDAFQVLAGCATALRLMYCAGWVHRDISTGNIMAVRGEGGKWKVKLADLEFAKKFPDDNIGGSHDPKTGTPFFMPYEILNGDYYSPDPLTLEESDESEESWELEMPQNSEKVAFLHNHQHDLESLFWVLLWLITSRVNHDNSANWASPLFQEVTVLHNDRQKAFKTTMAQDLSERLHPAMIVTPLSIIVDRIRARLVKSMVIHSRRGNWKDSTSYSLIHATFFVAFQRLNDPSKLWATVVLQERILTPVYFPRPQFKSMARHMKRKVTDDGDYKLEPEEDEEDEPVSPTNNLVRGKVSRKRSKVAP